jgi:hypothetical protein
MLPNIDKEFEKHIDKFVSSLSGSRAGVKLANLTSRKDLLQGLCSMHFRPDSEILAVFECLKSADAFDV